MSYTQNHLDEISTSIAANDAPLKEARARLALVRSIGESFEGALRSYQSGSLAQRTVISPVNDGDGGLVLDRVKYPSLGPDGSGESPADVVTKLCEVLGPEIRKTYPGARCGTSKRGPKITFSQPVDAQDPSVDLVVALTRKEESGLWIPNLETDKWEASDPEKHVDLFASGTKNVVAKRRRIIRLLKAWNKQWDKPAFSSFHLSVLAFELVKEDVNEAESLKEIFSSTTKLLEKGGTTKDPAEVSKPLKLLESTDTAIARVKAAANAITEAVENDADEVKVQSAMARLYRNYVDAPASDKLAQAASALRENAPIGGAAIGVAAVAITIPRTRAYGSANIE